MSFERFARRMHIRANKVPSEVNRIKRLAALAIDQAVVLATPVDTGRARSNWIVSLGEPTDGTIEPYAPTSEGIGETANARAAISQGQAEISLAKPEQPICIANNLDYIGRLNDGYSAQAPAMFVEEAINVGVAAIRETNINTEP